MKMKKFLLVGLLGVVTLCGLSSCDDDDDGGYVPFSYAVGDMVVKSCSNIKKTDEADRSMTDIFKFHMGCFPGSYRFIRIFVFQCLNT